MTTSTPSTETVGTRVATTLREWDRGAWCLAALSLISHPGTGRPAAGSGATTEAMLEAARDVLAASGVTDTLLAESPFGPADLDGMASAPLLQAAALVGGRPAGWSGHDDATLSAQGRASGSAAALFAHFVLGDHPDLAAALARPGARMLDTGTGVAALAVGFARTFPQLRVTGLDVLPRALDLARVTVARAGLGDRIELRHQDVADLDEQSCYDLAWLPAPFIPDGALRAGVVRIARALRPGGLLMIGHGRFDGSEAENAVTRLQTLAYGGTPLPGPAAATLLEDAGLDQVHTCPTPPGAPGLTLGIRR